MNYNIQSILIFDSDKLCLIIKQFEIFLSIFIICEAKCLKNTCKEKMNNSSFHPIQNTSLS